MLQASSAATVVQELHKICPWHGARVVVTLNFITVLLAQEFQLSFRLHPFRHHADLQAVSQADNGTDDMLGVGRLPQFLNERLVDFYEGYRQVLKIAE